MKSFAAMAAALLALALAPALAAAQEFGFDAPMSVDDPALPAAVRDLASRIVPVYQEEDSDRYFANLAALQLTAGDASSANATRRTLRVRLQGNPAAMPTTRAVVYDIYTQARANEETEHVSFEKAYAEAFGALWDGLPDLEAYELEDAFVAPTAPLRDALQRALDRQRGKSSIDLEQAIELVRAWFAFESFRSFGAVVRPLLAADQARRYAEEEIAIPVSAEASVAATVIRPRRATGGGTLPTLLEFTLDRSGRDPRQAAAHGYVSVLALSRLAGDPQSRPRAPFESEGDDARAVIDWIAHQPWSDGRVGMQGNGYGGFAAWAAAKKRPAALQAIATSDPMAPGIDVPMTNRIAHNSAYRWAYRMLAEPDDKLANDDDRWRALDEEWFRSGRSYRELPAMPGPAAAVFRRWLNHPSYDRFWQKWLPYGDELAKLDIPILTVTGYYSAGETAALYYYTEHRRRAPNADHTLLIGPFDEQAVARGPSSTLHGLTLDSVALIDPNAARYDWFDHALGKQELPELLRASVNYELVGANEWRHAPSLDALEQNALRYFLQARSNGPPHALAAAKPSAAMSLTARVDLRDRTDFGWRPAEDLVLRALHPREGTVFTSAPLKEPLDVAGRLRGELDFTVNKYDVDLVMTLYELRADGEYVKLFAPAYEFRASYARDRVHRRLLQAGVRQKVPFQSERMVGRRLQAGSRLVLTLGVNKRADQQINYGTDGDVSEQSIADAGPPLRIRWHEGSFIEIASP